MWISAKLGVRASAEPWASSEESCEPCEYQDSLSWVSWSDGVCGQPAAPEESAPATEGSCGEDSQSAPVSGASCAAASAPAGPEDEEGMSGRVNPLAPELPPIPELPPMICSRASKPPPMKADAKLYPVRFDECAVWCPACEMWLNGTTQWEDHKIGKKHRKNTGMLPEKKMKFLANGFV